MSLRVNGRPRDLLGITTGVPQIAADLSLRPTQPCAKDRSCTLIDATAVQPRSRTNRTSAGIHSSGPERSLGDLTQSDIVLDSA